MTASLRDRFIHLLEQHVQRLNIRGQKALGLCPFHQEKTPSFSANLEKCVFYCFGCGEQGGVRRFAELTGEPWTTSQQICASKVLAHRRALQAAQNAFHEWERRRFKELVDFKFNEFLPDIEAAELAIRMIHRCPDSLTFEERRYWNKRLGDLYTKRDSLEWDLNLLTFRQYELARTRWWKEETEKEDRRAA